MEAAVDKDLTACLLAIAVGADRFLVLTDVPAVMADFGTPDARPLSHLNLDELATLQLPAGSMGSKITACEQFVRTTGHSAAIGALPEAVAILAGSAGTPITGTHVERPTLVQVTA